MTALSTLDSLDLSLAVADLLARGPDAAAIRDQARAVGGCEAPIRLRGSVATLDTLTGEVARVWSSDGLPDGVQHVACKNRRASRCAACSAVYQQDAFHLVAAGLRGGKGVPDSVAGHPAVFVTMTAPSFGVVHSHRLDRYGRAAPCHVRRELRGQTCEHGRPVTCTMRHHPEDPALGQPLCLDCFDYAGAVLWNAHASELWRYTRIRIPRELARLLGTTEAQVRREVSVQYVKVAEYQRRGLVHFHLVLRLDAAPPPKSGHLPPRFDPPPANYTPALLEDAIRAAVAHVEVPYPDPVPVECWQDPGPDDPTLNLTLDPHHADGQDSSLPTLGVEAGQGPKASGGTEEVAEQPLTRVPPRDGWNPGMRQHPVPAALPSTDPPAPSIPLPCIDLTPRSGVARWGAQLDIRPLHLDDLEALHEGMLSRGQVAGYLAKYATKHTEALGRLDRRVRAEDLATLPVNPHVHRLVLAAWWLASRYRPQTERQRHLRLDAWAHQLGYGGHFLTKSRRYSTTFTALRRARADWQRRRHHDGQAGTDQDADRLRTAATWTLVGIGWRTPGDALLAQTLRARAVAARQAARDARADLELAQALAA